VIERFVISLIVAMVAIWVVSWLLAHLGLIFVAALGFGGWARWRSREHA
jgi:uncharacterized protein HemY